MESRKITVILTYCYTENRKLDISKKQGLNNVTMKQFNLIPAAN